MNHVTSHLHESRLVHQGRVFLIGNGAIVDMKTVVGLTLI